MYINNLTYDILFTGYSISFLTHFESSHYCHTTHFHVHWALCPAAMIYIDIQGTHSLNFLCLTTNPNWSLHGFPQLSQQMVGEWIFTYNSWSSLHPIQCNLPSVVETEWFNDMPRDNFNCSFNNICPYSNYYKT